MSEIKRCGDCIHADVCERNPNIPLFNRANAAFCEGFKDRNELIEVIRCKDCRFIIDRVDGTHGCYRHFMDDCNHDDFCSYGERTCHDKN